MSTLVALVVLGGLVVAADRAAAVIASAALARSLRDAEDLDVTPGVSVRGWFLPQLARGRFGTVDVGLTGLHRDDLRVQRVDLRLQRVQFPLSAVAQVVRGGQPERLLVGHADARLLVTHDDLSAMLRRRGLRVEAGPDGHLRVRVLNPVPVLGSVLVLGADSSLRVDGTHLVVRAERFLVGTGIANALLSAAIGGRFDFRVEVGPLPVPVQECEVTGQGLVLRGAGDEVVLDTAA